VIGHAFVAHAGALKEEIDADRCDSQRDIAVGGLEIVNSNNFAEMSYVALGHLHGPKNVGHTIENGPLIRYSGSILRYSFSEAKHSKSFSIVDLDASGTVTAGHIQEIAIQQPRQMQDLSGSIEELLSDKHIPHTDSFVRLTIVEEQVPANYYAQLANRYKFIVSHKIENPRSGEASATDLTVMSVDQIEPLDLMKEFFTQAKGHLPSDPQEEIMQTYLEKARRELGA
jgi:exonuclease SbcD